MLPVGSKDATEVHGFHDAEQLAVKNDSSSSITTKVPRKKKVRKNEKL